MGSRILIIDDDPAFRELVSESLKGHIDGIVVDQARDAASGENIIRGLNIYDLILLDYRMPNGYNGIDFLTEVGSLLDETDVIMITGQGDEEIAARAFRHGVTDYFIKGPRLFQQLIERVLDILARHGTDKQCKSSNPNSAYSGIEMIKYYQKDLDRLRTEEALKGENMLLEFREMGEFNKFSRLVKFLRGVKVTETKILDNKYVLLVNLKPARFERIAAL